MAATSSDDTRALTAEMEQMAQSALTAPPTDCNVYMRCAAVAERAARAADDLGERRMCALAEHNQVLRAQLQSHAPEHPLLASRGAAADASAARRQDAAAPRRRCHHVGAALDAQPAAARRLHRRPAAPPAVAAAGGGCVGGGASVVVGGGATRPTTSTATSAARKFQRVASGQDDLAGFDALALARPRREPT